MLRIFCDGTELDLGQLDGISYTDNPGLLEIGGFVGSYTIPFTIPDTPSNHAAFRFQGKLDAISREVASYPGEIWHSGICLKTGSIKGTIFVKGEIECTFYQDNGEMISTLNTKKMNENNYGGPKTFVKKTRWDPDNDDYVLYPVYNPGFYKDTSYEMTESFKGLFDASYNQFPEKGVSGYTEDVKKDDFWYIYRGGTLGGQVVTVANSITANIDSPGQTASNWTISGSENRRVFHNNFIDGDLEYPLSGALIITPFPLLFRVLRYLFSNLGYRYIDSYFTTGLMRTLNIFNVNNAIKHYYETVGDFTYLRNKIETVDIAEHLPEMVTTDFLKAIQGFFNIVFYVQNHIVRVVDRTAMVASTEHDDLTDNLVGYIRKELTGNAYDGVKFSIKRDSNDNNVSNIPDPSDLDDITETGTYPGSLSSGAPNQAVVFRDNEPSYKDGSLQYWYYANFGRHNNGDQDYWVWLSWPKEFTYTGQQRAFSRQCGFFLGKQELEIDAGLSCVADKILDNFPDNFYDDCIPKCNMKGNCGQSTTKSGFGLRLMQYRGVQPNVESKTLPHGSWYRDDMSVDAYWSWKNRWESFAVWYREAVKADYDAELMLTASQIKNFDYSRKKLINDSLFFVTSMEVSLGRTRVENVKVKMLKDM